MKERTSILHLRAATHGIGGPDKTILKTAETINSEQFDCHVAYLLRRDGNLDEYLTPERRRGLQYVEFNGRPLFDFRQFQAICAYIRTHAIHILHTHDVKTDVIGLAVQRQFPKLRLVSTVHGWIPRRRRSNWYRRLDAWALRWYDQVIVVTKDLQNQAAAMGIRGAKLIYNAIDIDEWRPTPDAESRNEAEPLYVGFVGRLSKEKGPMVLAHLAQEIVPKFPSCLFEVIGSGPEEERLRQKVNSLGLANYFNFYSHIPNDQLPKRYQKIHVLVLPSATEGLPNTLLEAGAMAKPVVAYAVGGVGEIIENGRNGFLIPAEDRNQMVARVLDLLQSVELRDRMGKSAREIIESRFSLSARMRQVESIYSYLRNCQNA